MASRGADTSKRGFGSMNEDKQREIASKGGKAAHEKGTAHEFTPDEARMAGRKGGETVSRDREHMAEIGRKGGEAVSRDREHMAEIGRKGGESRGSKGDNSASKTRRLARAKSRAQQTHTGRQRRTNG